MDKQRFATESSAVEKILEHLFLAEISQEAFFRSPGRFPLRIGIGIAIAIR